MPRRSLAFVAASVASAGLFAIISVGVHAQTPKSQKNAAKSDKNAADTSESDKPYDLKASFAKVPTGKVPRLPDGRPDLQGIWVFSVLTPLERPNAQKKTEIAAADAEELEDAAQKAEIDLRVESTVTPPGEKTTDAYNSFWRDGYWYKVPMTTLHTSQVVDPPDGRVPPITADARKRGAQMTARINRPARSPEDRSTTSRCVRGPRGLRPSDCWRGTRSQETTLQLVESPTAVVVRQEAMHDSQLADAQIPDGRFFI